MLRINSHGDQRHGRGQDRVGRHERVAEKRWELEVTTPTNELAGI